MSTSIKESLSPLERNLLLNPPYPLNIPLDDLLGNNRKIKKPFPPRPQNAWIIFRKNFESEFRSRYPNSSVLEISRIASTHWKSQPDFVKNYFEVLSKLARQQHKHAYPGYTYAPRRQKLVKPRTQKYEKLVIVEGKIAGYRNKKCAKDEENRNRIEKNENENKQMDKRANDKEVSYDVQHKDSATPSIRNDMLELPNVNNMPSNETYQADNYAFTDNIGINLNSLSFNYYPVHMYPLVDMTRNEQPYIAADGYVNEDYFTYNVCG
ncbi:10499_t:CDS:1 [Paraglomus brasilianum]|uniref:10499_t:CDS:1 n=1 Tax=Paraglomus brasilianum TaxID=144538 RepID=A0A9N9BS09_9GLOM|nr:10499_t:CDS:1 [Paraglomus brasilianum]